ncbi:MAG: recombination regulator RecX [Bacillota bacterium]|uniref:recombination regulator RecX n=1 Tax=Virgibacillus salarius TaxID=447199 RepID=UPI00249320B7|nr:recombination regulator RecX [Virgibacillus salarius]WBX80355.1 recombination regulator RecX [Virgibacillus salarius]
MRKITRITTQKKNSQRYNVYVSEGEKESFGFGIDEAILIEFQLRKGMELDEATITELLKKDIVYKSYLLAINFLSYRMRSRKEIHDYLLQKEVEPEHISMILDRLSNENLIDDRQFAEMFVRTRMNTSSKGPMIIKKELMEKGVAPKLAEEAIQLYTYEAQYKKVIKLVQKKLQQKRKDSFRKQLQNVQGTLQQKGFSQDIIQTVLDESRDGKDVSEEWTAIIYQGEKLLKKHSQKLTGYELKQKIKEGLYRKGFTFELIHQFVDEYNKESDHF